MILTKLLDTSFPSYGIQNILESILVSEEFRESFIVQFPEADEHIKKYIVDPKCRCRANITNLIISYKGDLDELGLSLYGNPCRVVLPQSIAGEFVDILADQPMIYKTMIKMCESFGLAYRGISIIPGMSSNNQRLLRIFFW